MPLPSQGYTTQGYTTHKEPPVRQGLGQTQASGCTFNPGQLPLCCQHNIRLRHTTQPNHTPFHLTLIASTAFARAGGQGAGGGGGDGLGGVWCGVPCECRPRNCHLSHRQARQGTRVSPGTHPGVQCASHSAQCAVTCGKCFTARPLLLRGHAAAPRGQGVHARGSVHGDAPPCAANEVLCPAPKCCCWRWGQLPSHHCSSPGQGKSSTCHDPAAIPLPCCCCCCCCCCPPPPPHTHTYTHPPTTVPVTVPHVGPAGTTQWWWWWWCCCWWRVFRQCRGGTSPSPATPGWHPPPCPSCWLNHSPASTAAVQHCNTWHSSTTTPPSGKSRRGSAHTCTPPPPPPPHAPTWLSTAAGGQAPIPSSPLAATLTLAAGPTQEGPPLQYGAGPHAHGPHVGTT
jgi:hypothetical protein